MKRMLVNATQQEELRVAVVDGQKLYDLDIEIPSREQRKANIYKGRITRLEPSLEAAFVDFGASRHGFLPLKEVSPEYYTSSPDKGGRANIRDVLKEGQEIVVQVEKDERGNKGAALTTYLSLAGRFLVLMPNNPKAGGVSRRIQGDDREAVREAMDALKVPEGMGAIVRTAGVGRSAEELQWDLDTLLQVWEAIKRSAVERPAPFLIYQESNAILRALRDHFSSDIGEVLVDDARTYENARDFMQRVMPHNLDRLKYYDDPVPLFGRFQIESQIESAYSHVVQLPSGGSVVIDHTEALLSIDINSARATKGEDIEATALQTNLEAADEIARQLRIRDLGGLIVIDFIDMGPQKNQREVENRLRDAVKVDRARVQIGRISRFGLLEMSRQRLRPSLGESSHIVCPRCQGWGAIRSIESLSLSILRLISEEARKERSAKIIADVPVDVGTYLLNEKRASITEIEERDGVRVVVVPRDSLESPYYDIRRVRDDALTEPENAGLSYKLPEPEQEQPEATPGVTPARKAEQPAVSTIVPATPAPPPAPARTATAPARPGLFARILAWFRSLGAATEAPASEPPQKQPSTGRRTRSGQGSGDQRSSGEAGQQRRNRRSQGQQQSRSQGKRGQSNRRSGGQGRKPADRKAEQSSQKEPRQEKEKSAQQASSADTGGNQGQQQGPGRSGRRRRRRGSRGGRRRQANQAGQDNPSQAQDASPDKGSGGERQDRQQPDRSGGNGSGGRGPADSQAPDKAAGQSKPAAGKGRADAAPESPAGSRQKDAAVSANSGPGSSPGGGEDRKTSGGESRSPGSQASPAPAAPSEGERSPPTGGEAASADRAKPAPAERPAGDNTRGAAGEPPAPSSDAENRPVPVRQQSLLPMESPPRPKPPAPTPAPDSGKQDSGGQS